MERSQAASIPISPRASRGGLGQWSWRSDYRWVLARDPAEASASTTGQCAGHRLAAWEEAAVALRRPRARPGFPDGPFQLRAAAFQRDLAGAEAEFRKLIRRYPLFADARAGLTACLWFAWAQGRRKATGAAGLQASTLAHRQPECVSGLFALASETL